MRGDSGVAGEGRVVGVPKFHSWGTCTMTLTNINSDWMSNASSGLCIIGAGLSEPHTSVTALSTCVCIWLAMLGPTTYRKLQISAYEILIFHDVHATCSYFS